MTRDQLEKIATGKLEGKIGKERPTQKNPDTQRQLGTMARSQNYD